MIKVIGLAVSTLALAISQSLYAQQAADIEVLEVSNLELSDWINKNLSFDQLILEFHNPDEDPHSGWVHVSFNSDNNRHEYKEAYKNEEGKTRYRLR